MKSAARTKAAASAAPVEPLKVRFKLLKETKGAARYAEVDQYGNRLVDDDDGAAIGYIYMRKAAMKKWLGTEEVPKVMEFSLASLG